VKAWGGDVIGTWPITSSIEALAGVGVVRARVNLTTDFTSSGLFLTQTGNISESASGTKARGSLGANWTPFPSWMLRVNYEYLDAVGTSFQPARPQGTGRSTQQTVWLSVVKSF
jgi:opacity protein-like surface antigen